MDVNEKYIAFRTIIDIRVRRCSNARYRKSATSSWADAVIARDGNRSIEYVDVGLKANTKKWHTDAPGLDGDGTLSSLARKSRFEDLR